MAMGNKHGAVFILLFCAVRLTSAQFEDLEGNFYACIFLFYFLLEQEAGQLAGT